MADENKGGAVAEVAEVRQDDRRLKEIALELFRTSRGPMMASKHLVVRCFREAKMFLEVAEEIDAGLIELDAADKNPLEDVYAPNLKKTHPVNVISRQFGRINKVAEIWEVIESEKVKTYGEYEWSEAEVNQARIIFPPVIQRAREMGLLKASSN